MKKHSRALLLLIANIFIFVATLNAINTTDPIEGIWKSMDRKRNVTGLWKFYIEKGKLYGVCLAALKQPIDVNLKECKDSYTEHPIQKDFSKKIMRETPLIYNLEKQSQGFWTDGYIIDARNGNRWEFDVTVHQPDGKKYKVKTLEIKGGYSIFKATQYWEATNKEEANKIILEVIKNNGSEYAKKNPTKFFE